MYVIVINVHMHDNYTILFNTNKLNMPLMGDSSCIYSGFSYIFFSFSIVCAYVIASTAGIGNHVLY